MKKRRDEYHSQIVAPGDRASKLAHRICVESYGNCPALRVIAHDEGNFRGPVGYAWQTHVLREMLGNRLHAPSKWRLLEEIENDGAGGKPQFFTLVGTGDVFSNLGWEIITMTADDFARSGRFPAFMANELNAKAITEQNFHLFSAAMHGYGRALKTAGLVNLTGETAIMKHSITAFCDSGSEEQLVLTWGGTCGGLARRKSLITGKHIIPGMPIVGFREHGYRCNGGTFFTNLLVTLYGRGPKLLKSTEAKDFARKLTRPSLSYARIITKLVGWNEDGSYSAPLAHLAGIAHITGGGVWGKLADILPVGVGAELCNMPMPVDVLLEAQEMSWRTRFRLTDWQAYGTLHGGCGMLLVCNSHSDALKVIAEAYPHNVKAMVVGHTVASPERCITIQSKFKQKKELSSTKPE